MRNAYTSLFALQTLLFLSNALPFDPQINVRPEALARRAKYSVVPVDGGHPAVTGEDGSEPAPLTIIHTVTQIASQTKSIIEKPPPTTDYISVTKTVAGPESTETSLVTIRPSPVTVTATGYSVINVISPVTVEVPDPQPTTSALFSSAAPSTSSAISVDPSPLSTTTSVPVSKPTISSTTSLPTSEAVSSAITPSLPTISSTISLPTSEALSSSIASLPTNFPTTTSSYLIYTSSISEISTTTAVTSSTTTTYDNGQWHTTYPSWSNSTQTRDGAVRRHAKPTPLDV